MRKKPTPQRSPGSDSSSVSETPPIPAGRRVPEPPPVPLSPSKAQTSQPTDGARRSRAPYAPPADCTIRCSKKQASKNVARALLPAKPGGTRITKAPEAPCVCDTLHMLRITGFISILSPKRRTGGKDLRNRHIPELAAAPLATESTLNASTTNDIQLRDETEDGRQDHLPRSGVSE
ncbi:hypothetical protein PCAR4_830023 [Paraburkholderia caribensis]|nr:hypothetical protein PCAR4_830023 [Paraburkholderia caribensis]